MCPVWSWIVVALGLIAAAVAVQFDEPWLEIADAATFVLLFAWVVVALRVRTGAVKSALSPRKSVRRLARLQHSAARTGAPTCTPR